MMDIIVEISTYIFMSILLGYFFGWLITKTVLKNRYKDKVKEITLHQSVDTQELNNLRDKIFEYKKKNKQLITESKRTQLGYKGQKFVLDEHNATLDEFQKRLLSKDEIIEALTHKLSVTEDKQRKVEKHYEEEIDAFMFERIELTQKYKHLLDKLNAPKVQDMTLKTSWISKIFSLPSATH